MPFSYLDLNAMFSNCSAVPVGTPNKDAWLPGGILKVGSTVYDIIVNPPTLEKVYQTWPTVATRPGSAQGSVLPTLIGEVEFMEV